VAIVLLCIWMVLGVAVAILWCLPTALLSALINWGLDK